MSGAGVAGVLRGCVTLTARLARPLPHRKLVYDVSHLRATEAPADRGAHSIVWVTRLLSQLVLGLLIVHVSLFFRQRPSRVTLALTADRSILYRLHSAIHRPSGTRGLLPDSRNAAAASKCGPSIMLRCPSSPLGRTHQGRRILGVQI